ncbi:MAG TPA: hypothetical protein HPP66_14045 [Planctomycetes bacterium]|nr:hypothetical protein [Planctomycetota bacterium]
MDLFRISILGFRISSYEPEATSLSSTTVVSALQISLFMQNKPNFRKSQMNVNNVLTRDYENKTLGECGKNKPNSNPIQTQSNPIQTQSNPIKANKMPKQTQYKPKQTQFQRQKMLPRFTINGREINNKEYGFERQRFLSIRKLLSDLKLSLIFL